MTLSPLEQLELVGRLALAGAMAGVLGWERQLGQQPAGLRTHMLVSIGAAAFTMAGTYGVSGLGTVQDAGRIAAQIVTGIGFIGAGTIWRSTGNERVIRGLTTAASIWVAASIGMLCGYGLYVLAAGSAVVGFAVLRLLRGLERMPGLFWQTVRSRVRTQAPDTRLEREPPALAAERAANGVADGMLDNTVLAVERVNGAAPDGTGTDAEDEEADRAQPASRGKSGGKQRRKKARKQRRIQTDDVIAE